MAVHESLTGIALVDYKTYEVTAVVDIGAGIDDVEYATFIMKSGGLLRWTTGCNTKYKLCKFTETDSAYSLGSDNYNNASGTTKAPRWNGDETCAPEYYGCVFTMSAAIARSDWDVGSSDYTGSNACAPKFLTADSGARCYVRGDLAWDFFSHIASPNVVSDGIVLNMASTTCIEFFNPVPANFNNFTAVDNHPLDVVRHVVYWYPSSTVENLSARNVTIIPWGSLTLKNPVGEIIKTDPSYDKGWVIGVRSYQVSCINAITKASINPQVTITSNLDNAVRYDELLVGGTFSGTLLDYFQADGTYTVSYDNDYRRAISLYGYKPLVTAFSVAGTAIDEGLLYVDPDVGVTSSTHSVVLAFTEITSAEQLYDAAHVFQITRTDRHNVGEQVAAASGSQIDFVTNSLVITADTPVGYPLTVAAGIVTAYTDGGGFAVSGKFNKLIAPEITLANASVVPTGCNLDADVELGEVSNLSNLTITGNLNFTVAGTYVLTSCSINTMTNTSGGSVIVQADPLTTFVVIPDVGEDITIETPPTTFTIEGLVLGGVLTIRDDEDGDTSIDLGTALLTVDPVITTSVDYVHSGTSNNIVVQMIATGYEEVEEDYQLLNINQTLTLSPRIDESL
jgi:hypothetical protein